MEGLGCSKRSENIINRKIGCFYIGNIAMVFLMVGPLTKKCRFFVTLNSFLLVKVGFSKMLQNLKSSNFLNFWS